jgi:deazaflavin-dependent oxidoreductase (nitroreductase family)
LIEEERNMERSAAVELFWRWHPRIYRWSGGRLLGRLAGLPVLLLETTGRRSGERRETALTYLPWTDPAGPGQEAESPQEAFVVVASVLGEPRHPAWYLNLAADRRVAVTIGRQRIAVLARDAEGAERERIWSRLLEHSPDYAEVAQRTTRHIPVVVLERRARTTPG